MSHENDLFDDKIIKIKIPNQSSCVFKVPIIDDLFVSDTPNDVIDYVLDDKNYVYKNRRILDKNEFECGFYLSKIKENDFYVHCDNCGCNFLREYIVICVSDYCYKCNKTFEKENCKIIIYKNVEN